MKQISNPFNKLKSKLHMFFYSYDISYDLVYIIFKFKKPVEIEKQ